jgi:hypothetical protein
LDGEAKPTARRGRRLYRRQVRTVVVVRFAHVVTLAGDDGTQRRPSESGNANDACIVRWAWVDHGTTVGRERSQRHAAEPRREPLEPPHTVEQALALFRRYVQEFALSQTLSLEELAKADQHRRFGRHDHLLELVDVACPA